MRTKELARRNLTSVLRDPLSLGLAVALPVGMLLILVAVGRAVGEADAPWMAASVLTPGIALFGFVMLMFSSAMALSRDRDSSLLSRMLTAPVSASDFIAGYSVPYLPVAFAQALVLYVIGAFFGLEIIGNVGLVVVVLGLMAVFYIALGMIFGATLTVNQVTGAYSAVLLLTIFGGAWLDLSALGGAFEAVGNLFPFAHALDAARAVMVDGAGLGDIAGDLAWVAGYTLVSVAAAVGLFRRQMVR